MKSWASIKQWHRTLHLAAINVTPFTTWLGRTAIWHGSVKNDLIFVCGSVLNRVSIEWCRGVQKKSRGVGNDGITHTHTHTHIHTLGDTLLGGGCIESIVLYPITRYYFWLHVMRRESYILYTNNLGYQQAWNWRKILTFSLYVPKAENRS